jgi:hypothetical protein
MAKQERTKMKVQDQSADLSAMKWNEAWLKVGDSQDPQWVRAVARCADNSMAVRLAAERRMRELGRESRKRVAA